MLLAAFGLAAGLFHYGFALVRVEGSSMEPTYRHGDWLLMRRPNWPQFPMQRNEVIIFRHGDDILIKRIAALPGERPPLDDLRILRFRNMGANSYGNWIARHVASLIALVPDSHVYVLGDNPGNSDDSRYFGPVHESEILGRVVHWGFAAPPDREQIGYRPRRKPSGTTRDRGTPAHLLASVALPGP
jgi:signal peptidase I